MREITGDHDLPNQRGLRGIRVNRHREHRRVRARHAHKRAIDRARRRAGRLVVRDVQHRVAQRAQLRTHRPGRIAQREQHRARRIRHRVVEHHDVKSLNRVARTEDQHAVGAAIIEAVNRSAVGRRESHGVRHIRHARANDGDREEAAILSHSVNARAELEINLVVEDRDRRVADRKTRGACGHRAEIRQRQSHRAIHVHDRVVIHAHGNICRGLARREIQHQARHVGVVHAADRREILRVKLDTRCVGQRALAQHGHHGREGGFADVVIRRAEGEHAVVVENRERRHRLPEQQPAGVAAQRQIHRAIHVRRKIIENPDSEGLRRRVAVGPEERAVRADIIDEVGGRAVRRRKGRRDRALIAVRADDRDGREGWERREHRLAHREVGAHKRNRAGAKLVVHNRQRRIRLNRDGVARRVERVEQHGPVRVRGQVVDDADLEEFVRPIAIRPREISERVRVIDARDRRAVAHRVADSHDAHQAAHAPQGDRRGDTVLGDAERGRAEAEDAVVVENIERRHRLHAERGADTGVRQLEAERAGALDDVVVEDGNRERAKQHAITKGQTSRRRRVILERQRQPVRRGEIHRGRARRAAEPRHRDDHTAAIFRDAEGRREEHEAARADVRAAIEPRDVVVRDAVHHRERAREQHLAVGLHGDRGDKIIRALAHVERRVEAAVGSHPRNAILRAPINILEAAADHNLAVCLQRQAAHVLVRARLRIEG